MAAVVDEVECAECHTRYDSDANPFCPRCGSMPKGKPVPAALVAAQRHDPARRRVQASGVVLVVVGSTLLLLFLPVALLSGAFTASTMEDLFRENPDLGFPGGELRVVATDGGTPAAGLPVDVQLLDGRSIANGTTDAAGQYNTTLGDHAVVQVVVAGADGNWTRKVFGLEGTTTTVRIDIAQDPQESDRWAGLAPILRVVRIVLVVFSVVAALLVAAGICAVRLRAWSFAVSAAALGAIPAILLFFASLNVGTFLIVIVLGVPFLFITRGRRHFSRPT